MHDCYPTDAEAANSLLLAVVAASQAPLLLLDDQSTILAASTSFIEGFDEDPARIKGCALFGLGAGEWDAAPLRSLLSSTASDLARVGTFEMDLVRAGRETRQLVLSAQKLSYAALDRPRLLLTVSDVTEARLAEKLREKLLGEKTVLLQELQHRVANSLQIIASVLMQSARRVQSEETRVHLYEAHSRVMSVAAVQRQLAGPRMNDVAMRSYLTELCASIGVSLIASDGGPSLAVTVDDSVGGPDFTTSIGLIVTELVINALKHAFPDRSRGAISVNYREGEGGWALSVADDGVGMRSSPHPPQPGLGTSIVNAIAGHLSAVVRVGDAEPGTVVRVTRSAGDTIHPVVEAV